VIEVGLIKLNVQYKQPGRHFISQCRFSKGNSNKKCLGLTSPVRPILEYGAACWDPYREGQINALYQVLQEAAKFADHTSDSVWKTLAQRRKTACICTLFKAYFGERAWNAVGGRLQGPRYLSRDDHDRKIWARKRRRDIGVYSFVNRITKLWNQLPVEAVATFNLDQILSKRGVRKYK
jgi:hypothetical protein